MSSSTPGSVQRVDACWASGFPSTTASCFVPPNRDPTPAASTTPEITTPSTRPRRARRKKFLIIAQTAAMPRPIPPTGLATAGRSCAAVWQVLAGGAPDIGRSSAAAGPVGTPAPPEQPSPSAPPPCDSCRQSANCCVSFLEISGSSPRDSCAAAPVSVMSASIFTRGLGVGGPGSSHEVTFAFAAPLPFCSMPLAREHHAVRVVVALCDRRPCRRTTARPGRTSCSACPSSCGRRRSRSARRPACTARSSRRPAGSSRGVRRGGDGELVLDQHRGSLLAGRALT